jgi:hypothetical protein
VHHGDEVSKIQTMENTKGKKTQFLQQMKFKGRSGEKEGIYELKLQCAEIIKLILTK